MELKFTHCKTIKKEIYGMQTRSVKQDLTIKFLKSTFNQLSNAYNGDWEFKQATVK